MNGCNVPVACCFDFCKTNISGVSGTKVFIFIGTITKLLLKYH